MRGLQHGHGPGPNELQWFLSLGNIQVENITFLKHVTSLSGLCIYSGCSLLTVPALCARGSQLAPCCVWQLRKMVLRYVIINIHSTKNPHFMGCLWSVDALNVHLLLLTNLCAATFPASGGHICIFDPSAFPPYLLYCM